MFLAQSFKQNSYPESYNGMQWDSIKPHLVEQDEIPEYLQDELPRKIEKCTRQVINLIQHSENSDLQNLKQKPTYLDSKDYTRKFDKIYKNLKIKNKQKNLEKSKQIKDPTRFYNQDQQYKQKTKILQNEAVKKFEEEHNLNDDFKIQLKEIRNVLEKQCLKKNDHNQKSNENSDFDSDAQSVLFEQEMTSSEKKKKEEENNNNKEEEGKKKQMQQYKIRQSQLLQQRLQNKLNEEDLPDFTFLIRPKNKDKDFLNKDLQYLQIFSDKYNQGKKTLLCEIQDLEEKQILKDKFKVKGTSFYRSLSVHDSEKSKITRQKYFKLKEREKEYDENQQADNNKNKINNNFNSNKNNLEINSKDQNTKQKKKGKKQKIQYKNEDKNQKNEENLEKRENPYDFIAPYNLTEEENRQLEMKELEERMRKIKKYRKKLSYYEELSDLLEIERIEEYNKAFRITEEDQYLKNLRKRAAKNQHTSILVSNYKAKMQSSAQKSNQSENIVQNQQKQIGEFQQQLSGQNQIVKGNSFYNFQRKLGKNQKNVRSFSTAMSNNFTQLNTQQSPINFDDQNVDNQKKKDIKFQDIPIQFNTSQIQMEKSQLQSVKSQLFSQQSQSNLIEKQQLKTQLNSLQNESVFNNNLSGFDLKQSFIKQLKDKQQKQNQQVKFYKELNNESNYNNQNINNKYVKNQYEINQTLQSSQSSFKTNNRSFSVQMSDSQRLEFFQYRGISNVFRKKSFVQNEVYQQKVDELKNKRFQKIDQYILSNAQQLKREQKRKEREALKNQSSQKINEQISQNKSQCKQVNGIKGEFSKNNPILDFENEKKKQLDQELEKKLNLLEKIQKHKYKIGYDNVLKGGKYDKKVKISKK
ncbi:hypothetical protein PPERSA_04699 [Pseudocohnilembus persalinus]|uniref:Uncharacterized protein n=1 Tax=Pseudocohnilembus persalinus TaxID=266149 RepID=A0A0V0R4I5_PSEPJ|nr:hypothetical protein PPERSA_04699 [Pseudocohnilembus persalinus]|eukprot:KRX09393.1 hypothetical protein PPERSA_04699 [Pseudocohnilembus persalinus]